MNRGIMVACDCKDLTKCDRCILNLLRPHLMQTEANPLECSQIQQVLTQFKYALDQGKVICLAIDGQVQFVTPQTEHLLNQYVLPSP